MNILEQGVISWFQYTYNQFAFSTIFHPKVLGEGEEEL